MAQDKNDCTFTGSPNSYSPSYCLKEILLPLFYSSILSHLLHAPATLCMLCNSKAKLSRGLLWQLRLYIPVKANSYLRCENSVVMLHSNTSCWMESFIWFALVGPVILYFAYWCYESDTSHVQLKVIQHVLCTTLSSVHCGSGHFPWTQTSYCLWVMPLGAAYTLWYDADWLSHVIKQIIYNTLWAPVKCVLHFSVTVVMIWATFMLDCFVFCCSYNSKTITMKQCKINNN